MDDKRLVFSRCYISISESDFDIANYHLMPSKEVVPTDIGGSTFMVQTFSWSIIDDRFACLQILEGDATRPETVIDRKSLAEETNPRTADQIEQDNQKFFIFDLKHSEAYLSDFREKAMIEKYLADKTSESVTLKMIIDEDEFVNNLNSVAEISLFAKRGLFTPLQDLSDLLEEDRWGFGVSKTVAIKIKYGQPTKIGDYLARLRQGARDLIAQSKESGSKLMIVGRGSADQDFEKVYNSEGIVEKVSLKVKLKSDGLVDADDVFEKLTCKIKANEGKNAE